MAMIISVSYYLITVLVPFRIASNRYRKMKAKYASIQFFQKSMDLSNATKYKLTTGMILFMALLFASYNVLVTRLSVEIGGDRTNYMLNFYGLRPSPSLGLTFIISVIRKFTSNVDWLWYVSTLTVMSLTLFGYRISGEATPQALLFLLTTQYVFFTFTAMKQCYATGFLSLCWILALRDKGISDRIACLILLTLAYLFHPTAFVAIPLCVIIWLKCNRRFIFALLLMMLLVLMFLEPLAVQFAKITSLFLPGISNQVYTYLTEEARIGGDANKWDAFLNTVKGIPFYIVTGLGLAKRRKLKRQIKHYDNYLLLSAALSLIYLASFYNGWIYRLAYYFYFPVAIFYAQIMRFISGDKKILIHAAVMGLNFLFTIRFLFLIYMLYGGF